MKTPFPGMDPYLDTILHVLYTRAGFDLRLEYIQPLIPPLRPTIQTGLPPSTIPHPCKAENDLGADHPH